MEFSKLEGTGNDFIIVDNRDGKFEKFVGKHPVSFAVRKICNRKRGIGADGLILIEDSDRATVKWRFYNSDGSTAEMCGNGARCAARFAYERGIAPKNLTIETGAGVISAEVKGRSVKVKLTPPRDFLFDLKVEGLNLHFVNTGVPHAVVFVDRVDAVDVEGVGRKVRFSEFFSPAGVNVNFAEVRADRVVVRTYERGVEGETLACGTGSVASALVAARLFSIPSPVEVEVRSGERLRVYFDAEMKEVYLEGETTWIADGNLREEFIGGA